MQPAFERLQKLPGFKACGKNQYEAQCPAHEDRKASLSISIGANENILLYCHAKCDLDRVLRCIGLQEKDLFAPKGNNHKPESAPPSYWRRVWGETIPLDNEASEPGRRYLENRGLKLTSYPKDIRFHSTLAYFVDQQTKPGEYPALVFLVRNAGKEPIGIQRIYITKDGCKAEVPEAKKAIGPITGGAIYFDEYENSLNVAEGPETGLAVWQGTGTPTCSTISAGGMSKFIIPDKVQIVDIWADLDRSETGQNSARELARRAHEANRIVYYRIPAGPIPEGIKGLDWLDVLNAEGADVFQREIERGECWDPAKHEMLKPVNQFKQESGEQYQLTLPQGGISIEADRLRREHNELNCELCVRCALPGARTYDGVLSVADFNLSSARARSERAKLLSSLSNTKPEEIDWIGILEEFSQRVLAAEREGQPAIDLRDLQKPGPDDSISIDGLSLPKRHPAFIFGDGGAAKSYVALYLAGRMAQRGINVALFDWELAGEDHRDRLERLFGDSMPRIYYARCERALVYEIDRLKRIVRENSIDYALFDSVAFATDGPPEAAESASRYFRAVRQIGLGSLHIAHITKGEGGEEKPFGSVFWHNGARSTWFAKLADSSRDGRQLTLGLFNKKANLGRLQPPTGFEIAFTEIRTYFKQTNPADNPELAPKMPIKDRMMHLLKAGEMSCEEIAKSIEAKTDTVRRTAQKHKGLFTVLKGGEIALLQRVS